MIDPRFPLRLSSTRGQLFGSGGTVSSNWSYGTLNSPISVNVPGRLRLCYGSQYASSGGAGRSVGARILPRLLVSEKLS